MLDYHDGVKDLRAKRLRMIGEPEARYREDPVRMLRAVRFAAKLGFQIDEATREPIHRMGILIENVPAARLFDEMLKLLMSGHAVACITRLRAEGLHHGLLPLLDVILEQPAGERFVMLALSRTDERVRAGKRVSPGYLFATLLWHDVLVKWNARTAKGEHRIPALEKAIDETLDAQTEKLAIQRRFIVRHARDLGTAAALRAPPGQGAAAPDRAHPLPGRIRLPDAARRGRRGAGRVRRLVDPLSARQRGRARADAARGGRAKASPPPAGRAGAAAGAAAADPEAAGEPGPAAT